MADQDDAFERIVEMYVEADMPSKHGMTPDEYRAFCAELWKNCQTDDRFPDKVLIDRHYQDTHISKAFNPAQYVDPRARAATDVEERPNDPIYCIAVGTIPLAEWFSENASPENAGKTKEESDSEEQEDIDLWIVAVLDILGFERMYRALGPQRLIDVYEALIERAKSSTETTAVGMSMVKYGDGDSPTLFHFKLGFTYFSDTLLLWAPLTPNHMSPFLARCADVVIEALKLGIPIRGAVAVGEAVMDKQRGLFVGSPLIEAARLEHAQDWLGVSLGRSCGQIAKELDSSLVLPYTPPCKPAAPLLHSGLVLDWPRRARDSGVSDPELSVRTLNTDPNYSKYYDNTVEFVIHSKGNASWNRDHRIPIAIGAIRRAMIQAALDNVPLAPEIESMLESLHSNGPEGEIAEKCFRALAGHEPVPPEMESLPNGPRETIMGLNQVINEDLVDVEEMVLASLEAGHEIRELSERQQRFLNKEPTVTNQVWQLCLPYLRAAAECRSIPPFAEDLPDEVTKLLATLRRAEDRTAPPVDMERLLAGVLYSNVTSLSLSSENQKRLEVMQQTSTSWEGVARFLESISRGILANPEIADYNSGALSTVKVVDQILAWQIASRRSIPDALDGIAAITSSELVALASGLLRFNELSESEKEVWMMVLDRVRTAGSPNDAVARYASTLLRDKTAQIPGGLGDDVSLFLQIVRAIGSRVPVEFPLEHLLKASIAVREGAIISNYDQASNILLAELAESYRELVGFLLAIAQRTPLPTLTSNIDEPARSQLTALGTQLTMPNHEAEVNIVDVGRAALRARLNGDGLGSEYKEFLAQGEKLGESYAAACNFLRALANPVEMPEVPKGDLPPGIYNFLSDLRVRALCGVVDEVDFNELTNSAVTARLHRELLHEDSAKILDGLVEAGRPFSEIAAFVRELSQPGSRPKVPRSVPLNVLGILAVARRKAYELDRTVVGVARMGAPVAGKMPRR